MKITTLSSWVLVIVETLESYNVDYRPILKKVGIDARELRNPNARFDIFAVTGLWNAATEETGDPCFGLQTVNHIRPTSLHALGYSWMASPTILEALNRLKRYVRIVNSAVSVEICEQGPTTRVLLHRMPSDVKISPTAIDASLATLIHLCRINYGKNLNPIKVFTQRPQPQLDCLMQFESFFNAPVQFSHKNNEAHFDSAIMTKPLPASNADLARANDKVIDEYLSHLDGMSIGIRTRAKITELLPSGSVTEEKIAASLHMSVRTMQRKLKEEGVSFKEMLNSTRQELANQYMENSRLSVNEITYLLGFSDPANFSRAFKRWHGVPPSQYRA